MQPTLCTQNVSLHSLEIKLFYIFVHFSLDQLLVSSLDQQKLQSVLSAVVPKCDVAAMLQEVKAQVKVKNIR